MERSGPGTGAPISGHLQARVIRREFSERGPTFDYRRAVERTLSLVSPLLLLGVWELGARVGVIDVRFFPAPSTIFAELGHMIRTGDILNCRGTFFQSSWCMGSQDAPRFGDLGISLSRIVIGYFMGAIPAVLLGLCMGSFRAVRAFFQPLIDATFPIPHIALLPLVLILFGIGELSKYIIVAISVFFIVVINTVAGVHNIDQIYRDVGRNYNAGRWQRFSDIALPGALPSILTGLRLAAGIALLVITAAEFVGATSGIGYLMWNSWQIFAITQMYVGLIIIAGLGFVSAKVLEVIEKRIVPWKGEVRD